MKVNALGAKLHMDRTAVTPLKEFVVNFQKKKNVALANLHMDRTAVTPEKEFVVNIQLSDWIKVYLDFRHWNVN